MKRLRKMAAGRSVFLLALFALLFSACGPKPGQNPPGGGANPPGGGNPPPGQPPGPETTAEIGQDGGTIKTENAELVIPKGAVYGDRLAKITLKDLPLEAPGPVPEQATLIAAAEVWRSNPYDEENDYFANFFRPPAPLRLSLRRAVAPAKNSTHYTEVCTWFGEEGDGWGDRNYWHCRLSSLGPGTDQKGQGYIEVELGGLDTRRQNYYVFQFPKEWADQNCVEAGGRINPNIPKIDFHSFKGACRGRPGGTVAQIGQLKQPEGPDILATGPRAQPQGPGTLDVLTWNVGQASSACFFKLCDEKSIRNISRLLFNNQPRIVTLQEMMVEDTYCARRPTDGKAKFYCDIDSDYTPVEPRVIDTILAEWKKLDNSVQLDYHCEQYECTIVNTAAFTFAGPDKRGYLTGGAEDTGYLWTQLIGTNGGPTLDLYNAHLASPVNADLGPGSDLNNAGVRAGQIDALTSHLRQRRASSGSSENVLVIGDHNLAVVSTEIPEADDLAIARQVSLLTILPPERRAPTWYDRPTFDVSDYLRLNEEIEADPRLAKTLLFFASRTYRNTGGLEIVDIPVLRRMIDYPLSNRFYGSCDYPDFPGSPAIKTGLSSLFDMDHNALLCNLDAVGTTHVEIMVTRCGVPQHIPDDLMVIVSGTGLTAKFDYTGLDYSYGASLFDIASTEAHTWYGFEKVDDFKYAVEVPNVFMPNALLPSSSSTLPVVFACPGGDLSKCRVAEIKGDEKYVFVELADPQQCTINYLLAADAGWGAVPEDDFDFVGLPDPNPDDQETGMAYELTLPDWLNLEPAAGTLDPGQRFTDVINVDEARAFCDGAVEKEGKITVRTQNPELEFEVPVRLMCAELDVRFDPQDYNAGAVDVEPEKRCGRLTGVVTVRGADHLQEMFAYDVYDGAGNYVETRYNEPFFDYVVEHPNYTSMRISWTGEYDPHRLDNAHDWDWSTFPEIPFFSWTTSCAFDEGEHQVNTFFLEHPKRIEGNERIDLAAANLAAPVSFTVHDNRFPGAVYNGARYCEPDGNGGEVCTEADALVRIVVPGRVDMNLPIDYGNWRFGLHPPFNQDYSEVVRLTDDEGNVLVDVEIPIPGYIPPEQLRYCRFNRTTAFRRSDASYFDVDGVPPVFWTQNIELHRTEWGVWYPYLIEGVAPWECYESWDENAGSVELEARALREGGLRPLDTLAPAELELTGRTRGGFLRFVEPKPERW